MIDKLSSQALSVGPGIDTGYASTPRPAPLGSDLERFRLALNATEPGGATVSAAPPTISTQSLQTPAVAGAAGGSSLAPATAVDAASVTARAAQAGRRSVGDSILDTFRSVANNASSEWSQARQAIMSPNLTATEMLQTQMKLINVSFQIDLIGKGVSKVTTNLEQTLKTQ